MVMEFDPEVQLGTDAVTLTFCGPSMRLLLTIFKLNTADVWPVLMTVVAGTVNFEGSLDVSETVTFAPTGVPILTDPAPGSVPADLEALAGKPTDNVAVSAS